MVDHWLYYETSAEPDLVRREVRALRPDPRGRVADLFERYGSGELLEVETVVLEGELQGLLTRRPGRRYAILFAEVSRHPRRALALHVCWAPLGIIPPSARALAADRLRGWREAGAA